MKTNERIFFIHVPKSAGMAVTTLLAQQFGAEAVVHLPAPRRGAAEQAQQNYRIVAGHFMMNQLSAQLCATSYMLSILREPVDRVLSLYHFYRQKGVATGPEVDRARHQELDTIMTEFRQPIICNVWSNLQTLIFAGVHPDTSPSRQLLDRAKRNLDRLDLVGVYERLPEAMRRLAADLELGADVQIPVINVTAQRRLRSELTEAEIAAIAEANSLDIELYQHAVELATNGRAATSVAGTPVEIDPVPFAPGVRHERGTREINITDAFFAGERRQVVWPGVPAVLRVELESSIDVGDFTVGFLITDSCGTEIYGTNTALLAQPLRARAGEKLAVSFEFEPILASGKYYVTLAAHTSRDDRERCFHWVDNFFVFWCDAGEPAPFVGLIDLKARAIA